MENQVQGYNLKAPFVEVTLRINGVNRTHIFRKPSLADLIEYQKAERIASRIKEDGSIVTESESQTAALGLWEKLCQEVRNYILPDGTDITAQENWKTLIPEAHKIIAAQNIHRIGVDHEYPVAEIGFDEVAIALKAVQAGNLVRGLVHDFALPKPSDMKLWQKLQAVSRMIRNKGEIVSVHDSRLDCEVMIYDRLIRAVDGYVSDGVIPPLAQLVEIMDPQHKSVAIRELFERLNNAQESDPLA